ncbi:kynurenine/alpha-aminoadipate aminotransferase, mitochondrial-like isoform X2 [Leptopilina boulardi]|uniref:kynurenine/alpha-aminoadipate aminotransferase, mitochondrial-like isoform X2 n=1 Tax=Leptopilina boulardi TaxID=63433 RepID=UPI0021F673E7|nr:kynurenine/alpha-aminoadipate aminotransferase, mitochondrial-like isoform X2 [Leptopilina boulardi]
MDYTKRYTIKANNRIPNFISLMALALNKNPSAIFFAGGMPNTQTFPFKEVNVSCKDGTSVKLKGRDVDVAFQYGPTKGYLPLVEKWRNFQEQWHAPKFNDWDVHFTAGSQEGCSKIFELFINSGDSVMVQTPTYTATLRAIIPLQPEFIEIHQDAEGVKPEEIEKICKEKLEAKKPLPKFLYVNPTGANPTGTVLSDKRKEKIYELAQKYDFLILEDDPYYFLHFLDKQPLSFLSMDTDGRVVRFDSFSKILSAGLRLGVVTAHKDILEKMSLHIQCTSLHPSSLSQVLVYKLFESWDQEKFENHFKDIQVFYRERRDMMLSAIEKHLTGLAEWTTPTAGMFVWVKITVLDDVYEMVMKHCIDQGIYVLPGHTFNADASIKCQNIRLCYSYATKDEIEKGLTLLAKIIKEESAKKEKFINSVGKK